MQLNSLQACMHALMEPSREKHIVILTLLGLTIGRRQEEKEG